VLPESTTRVGEIESFILDETAWDGSALGEDAPIPGYVRFKDGSRLDGIHQVVLATGYITSYPFLSHLHSDTRTASEAGPSLVVTAEGNMAHNLHKDIFYIPDPSLIFVGIPYDTATFSLFDFQAQAVARFLAGKAALPAEEDLRAEYSERVKRKGLGRPFHTLRGQGQELEYVKDLVDWVNKEAERQGIQGMQGHSEKWTETYWATQERFKKLFGRA
jgi:hypothetical protein